MGGLIGPIWSFASPIPLHINATRAPPRPWPRHGFPLHLSGGAARGFTRRGETWIATVIEVIERRDDFVLVRDSGKG